MPIHVAITRRVRLGCEAEFQRALLEFFQASFADGGVWGANLLTPPPGSTSREFGILRTFSIEQERDAFTRHRWQKKGTGNSSVDSAFAYDGLFRRIKKVAAGATHHSYYNLSWQIVELRLNASTSADRRYWWGMRNLNDLIRRQRPGSSETLYALDDAMNIVALVNGSAAVQKRMTYTPYGDVAFWTSGWSSSTNSHDWEFLYHGHYRDSQTGFYQMRYRYYHPLLGRWLNRDPIGERGGWNLYEFGGNDGVNWWDEL